MLVHSVFWDRIEHLSAFLGVELRGVALQATIVEAGVLSRKTCDRYRLPKKPMAPRATTVNNLLDLLDPKQEFRSEIRSKQVLARLASCTTSAQTLWRHYLKAPLVSGATAPTWPEVLGE